MAAQFNQSIRDTFERPTDKNHWCKMLLYMVVIK